MFRLLVCGQGVNESSLCLLHCNPGTQKSGIVQASLISDSCMDLLGTSHERGGFQFPQGEILNMGFTHPGQTL